MSEFTPKNILVTTDLSPESTSAYPHAKSLAKAYQAHLMLVCCIDTSIQFGVAGTFDMPVMYVPEVLSAVKDRTLRALNEHVTQYFPEGGISSHLIDRPLPVQNTIVEFIKESEVDLVVIASHGRSGISRAFLGSVAEQVIRHSSKPTLVVPLGGFA